MKHEWSLGKRIGLCEKSDCLQERNLKQLSYLRMTALASFPVSFRRALNKLRAATAPQHTRCKTGHMHMLSVARSKGHLCLGKSWPGAFAKTVKDHFCQDDLYFFLFSKWAALCTTHEASINAPWRKQGTKKKKRLWKRLTTGSQVDAWCLAHLHPFHIISSQHAAVQYQRAPTRTSSREKHQDSAWILLKETFSSNNVQQQWPELIARLPFECILSMGLF